MVLKPNGELAAGYNSTANLEGINGSGGSLSDVYESTNSSGLMTITLLGSFTKFDGKSIANVARVTLEP